MLIAILVCTIVAIATFFLGVRVGTAEVVVARGDARHAHDQLASANTRADDWRKSSKAWRTNYFEMLAEHRGLLSRMSDRVAPAPKPASDEVIPDPPSIRNADKAAFEAVRARPLDHGRVEMHVTDGELEPAYRVQDDEDEPE